MQGKTRAFDVKAEAKLTEQGMAVVVRFKRPFVGTDGTSRCTYVAAVNLGDGNPVTRLKEAMVELEQATGLRFEMFESVDITRQFIASALHLGYRIRGLPATWPGTEYSAAAGAAQVGK